MLLKIFVCGPIQNNTILCACEKTKLACVIDPSFDSSNKILNYLEKHDLKLDKIFITHSHWDHIAEVKKLKDQTNAKICIHKLDAKNLEDPGSDGLREILAVEKIKPDHLLEDNEKISVGNLEFLVIHTPGHSPGCCCFYLEDEDLLFSGDTLFKGSYGRLDLPTAQPELMGLSLEKLSKLPKETKVIPGHGPDTTIEKEKWIAQARGII